MTPEQRVMRRGVCLAALHVVDSILANLDWTEAGKELPIDRQPKVSAQEARRVHSLLVVTCKGETVNAYLTAIGVGGGEQASPTKRLNAFRKAIRRELELDTANLSEDAAFIGVLPGGKAK